MSTVGMSEQYVKHKSYQFRKRGVPLKHFPRPVQPPKFNLDDALLVLAKVRGVSVEELLRE